MPTRVPHLLIAISTINLLSACPSADPCDENPDSIFCASGGADETGGETDGETDPETNTCTPLIENQIGYKSECHGTGNGWLELDVYPVGPQPVECVNWGESGKPAQPTTADCVPLEFSALPGDIPTPGACCIDTAEPDDVVQQCESDCGYAACKLAVQKLRDAALALPEDGAQGVVRDDLFYFASMLEMPAVLKKCASDVYQAEGEPTPINLGPGASGDAVLGHVQSAILYLQCSIDDVDPYLTTDDSCDAPPNIPIIEHESNVGGVAAIGGVTIFGPDGDASASLYDIGFAFTQTHNRDGSNDFLLEQFTALAAPTSYGSFVFSDPSIRLATPAHGSLIDETVSFPPGALRMEVTAAITADGEALFDGMPVSGEYANSDVAIATRKSDGTFAFVEIPFEASGYHFVLNTEDGSFVPR